MALHTIELFAGVGQLGEGLRAGLGHLGVQTRAVCYVEREAYAASVLASRMQEGSLDEAPVWSDVCTFDAHQWYGAVDCVVAGFPCQDLSLAGRRAGLDGKRSGLFFEVVRIARDCGARYLFLENVGGIASATASVVDEAEGALEERAAARVLGELADHGWNAEWVTLSASDVGASHGRERWFCWAWRTKVDNTIGNGWGTRRLPDGCNDRHIVDATGALALGNHGLQHQYLQQRHEGTEHPGAGCQLADSECTGLPQRTGQRRICQQTPGRDTRPDAQLCGHPLLAPGPDSHQWPDILTQWPHLAPALEPSFHRVVDGLAHRMDDCRAQRLKCCGNGVVAAQASAALVCLVVRAMNTLI